MNDQMDLRCLEGTAGIIFLTLFHLKEKGEATVTRTEEKRRLELYPEELIKGR